MVTNIQEVETNTWINSTNSYLELKQEVEKRKELYYNEFWVIFDYFLFIENSNHHLLDKHWEILQLIKSNNKLDREEALSSATSVDSNIFNTIKESSNSTNNIITWEKAA
jgi:hypothetical protein